MMRFLVAAAVVLAAWTAAAAAAELPLKVSENGRFLVDQKGVPFLVVADSPWSLIAQLGDKDVEPVSRRPGEAGFQLGPGEPDRA